MKILQLTDIHFSNNPLSAKDRQSKKDIENLIKTHGPDLIAITGDLFWQFKEKDLDAAREILCFFDTLGPKIAITWGNHDSESDYARATLNEMVQEMDRHVFKNHLKVFGEREIYTVDVDEDNRLIFLDSGAYDETGIGHYAYITLEQIDYMTKLCPKKGARGYLFMHIPLPEYDDAKKRGFAIGNQGEVVCAPRINTGAYSQITLNSNIKHVFVGHDHDNDYSAEYFGVGLHYGRVSGYNAYGKLKRGGRIIDIAGENFCTYVVEAEEEKNI